MKLLIHSFKSPHENIAYEEQLFRDFTEDTLRLWINPTSVICGKHQIALKECNAPYCSKNNIPIIRRLSGGGTVFHDLGNVNFSFFRFVEKNKGIDYKKNLSIIRRALNKLGFDAHISPRNDLFLAGHKISGNAQHVSQGRALHHGTLLYNSNLQDLKPAIRRTSGHFIDKSVNSVSSSVANLKEYVNLGATTDFLNQLAEAMPIGASLTKKAPVRQELVKKYKSDAWNFGYGPKYEFHNSIESVKFILSVERGGKIINAESSDAETQSILAGLVGTQHTPNAVCEYLSTHGKRDDWLIDCLL